MSENSKVDEIVRAMSLSGEAGEIQRIQTAHRLKLIEFWEIPVGAKVLEIGCGQGDTLAALVYAVGQSGFAHGVDIADEAYGAPETLGQARERLMGSALGKNMRIDLRFNVMEESFAAGAFDYIVLSHCLWYFSSHSELKGTLTRIRPWGKKLCLAEWNPCVEKSEQLSHMKAVSIEAICECFKAQTQANLRTMFYPHDIERAVRESGWMIDKTGNVSSDDMQDAAWEIQGVRCDYPSEIEALEGMPDKLKALLLSQIHELGASKEVKAMATYCLRAKSV